MCLVNKPGLNSAVENPEPPPRPSFGNRMVVLCESKSQLITVFVEGSSTNSPTFLNICNYWKFHSLFFLFLIFLILIHVSAYLKFTRAKQLMLTCR